MGIIVNQGSTNTVILYLGVLIGAINTLFLYPNVLPPEEFGLITMIVTISFLMAAIGSFGTTISIVKYFPYYRNNETGDDKGLLKFVFQIATVITLIILGLLVVAKPWLKTPFENSASLIVENYYYLIPFIIVHILLELFAGLSNALFKTSLQLFVKEILLRLSQTILIGLYFFKLIDLQWFLVFYMCAYVLSFLIIIIKVKQEVNISFFNEVQLSIQEKVTIFRYGGYSFLSAFSRTLSFKIDVIMLSMLVASDYFLNRGLEATAIYAVALHMTAAVEMPFRGINQILHPIISSAWKNNNTTIIRDVYRKSTETMVIISGLLFILIWASIDELLTILPEKYEMVKYTFFWLGLGKFINAASGSNGNILINSSKYKIYSVVTVVGLVITIFTNYLLIPVYGVKGAALATFLTYVLINIALWYAVKYHYNMQPFNIKNIIVIAVLFLMWYISSLIKIDNVFLSIVAKSFFLTSVFITVVLKLNLSEDIQSYFYKLKNNFFKKF